MEFNDILKTRRNALNLTLEEVGEAVGVSKSTVMRWESGEIKNLRRDKIYKLAQILGIEPSVLMGWKNDSKNIIQISGAVPVMDGIAAGLPVLAQENIVDYMPVTVRHPEEYFALIVRGESMINAGIPNGSQVLVHIQDYADNGQIVACRINGDEATLKRFRQTGDTVLLMPENPNYEPIIVPVSEFSDGSAEILGVVKQVIVNI